MRRALLFLLMAAASSAVAPAITYSAEQPATPADLRRMASEYYAWRDEAYPVVASDMGKHTWDDRLTDYSEAATKARREHVEKVLAAVRAMDTSKWSKDDRIDWYLFRSQLEGNAFFPRVMRREESDPQVYVNECSNALFSILKKEYAPAHTRALAAIERIKKMPAMIEQGKKNLTRPIGLYAGFAIESARGIDPMFEESFAPLAKSLTATETKQLDEARKAALASIHGFADWLEARKKDMVPFVAMGEENYNYLLHNVYLLPFDARDVATLGETELARYRALESMLADPKLANPDPKRLAKMPADQAEFLKAYESRQDEMIRFLRDKKLVTLPDYLGPFYIRPLPDAFKPTSPGGFMNAPGFYDTDPSGFFFISTYDPKSPNFYVRAAIEEPRPILGHEGIPGHFLQITIANHLTNEIRRHNDDGVFIEGWALYGEEMLARTGLYPDGSAGQGQVLRLSRYRSARIGTDVNLHTGKWTFEQGVKYFMEAGGLDRVAAEGETAGAASEPSQKITYIVGKWQIMRLLGKYRDAKGDAFRLGQFHDDLLANGSLPLSVVEWILLDDPSTLEKATGGR